MEPITPSDEPKDYTPEQMAALKRVADDLHKLNGAVVNAVEAGLTVELMRVSRYHSQDGQWGDQNVPLVS